MSALVLRRLATGIPTLLLLVTLTFFLLRLAPGGPFDRERSLAPEVEAALAAEYHLDEPLPRQYLRYLGGLLRGDLGPSFQYAGEQVGDLIAQGLDVSARLAVPALVLALLLGGAAGIAAATAPGSRRDRAVSALSLLGLSLPSYVVAPLLVLVFAVGLRWLPAGGWGDGAARNLVLPVIALALPLAAAVARLLRASLLETLATPWVRTARAKGLPEHRMLLGHALRPALLPVVSWLGPATAALLTGSVVVEQAFELPGVGRYFVQGALNRDYTLVLGVVALYGALIVAANAVVDALYGVLDPRQRAAR